jgi:hypothetical protein
MSRNAQEVTKEVGKIFQNIYDVSTAADKATQVSSQTKDAANEFSKFTVNLQGLI